ncbi:hypothetical protein [Polaromonas aquatica]|uniref:hypothetical protein n=1 Tax=Polaromonas aquatica TaxID=332657 RepID=UPI003D652C9B
MLVLKLMLVALSVLLSTLAARRFGHHVGGAVAGMPMIAAPIIAILLLDHDAGQVRAVALATLVCLPAAIVHIVCFAAGAGRWGVPVCLPLALVAYACMSAILTQLSLAPVLACLLALAAPAAGLWFAAHHVRPATPVAVPGLELVLRVAAAVAMAAVIIVGADVLPPAVSGLLLAVPITGTVLPCFTLPRYGAAATRSLMAGFLQGLHGFAAFFITLYWALDATGRLAAFLIALGAALATAAAMQALRRRIEQSGTAGTA